MKRVSMSKKMMLIVGTLLSALSFLPGQAQEAPLVLTLEQALEIALSENPTVKVAEQEIEKTEYARKGAYAALFPQIDFSASYDRTIKKQVMYFDNQSVPVGTDNNYSLGFSAAMPLVNAQLWKSLDISALDVELAVEQARSSKIDMVNQVKKSFFAVLLAKDSYEVFLESYHNAMENYLDIERKYNQGLIAEYDLIRADVTVKNTEPNVFQAENALALAKWQLKALMAVDLNLNIECQGELTDYETDMYTDYVSSDTNLVENSSLVQMDIQTEQLQETLKMQKYEYIPTLSLTTNYQWTSMNDNFKFKDYVWNPYSVVGVTLAVPIFSGGSKYNNIRQTRVTINQIKLQREDTERNLELAVKQYRDNMATNIKQLEAARKAVDQSERGYLIAQKRYDTGAGTLLEVNDAELAMTQAKLNFNQAIYDYMVAKADLDKTLGRQF
ncbi:MAG: TolC family protein [Tannerellaceae bacterium]|nr:TolC family protein [Tannerellaceae bacterium]